MIRTILIAVMSAMLFAALAPAHAGKNCPIRGCTSGDDPNGISAEGHAVSIPAAITIAH